MIPVSSSRVTDIGWQPEDAGSNTGAVWVVFSGKDRTTGYYDNVPRQVFELFRDSDSKGRFLNSQLKGSFAFIKAPLPPEAALQQ